MRIIGTLLFTSMVALAGDAYVTVPSEAIAGVQPMTRDIFAIDGAIHTIATGCSRVLLDGGMSHSSRSPTRC